LRVLDPRGESRWERRAPERPVAISGARAAVEGDTLVLDWTVDGAADVWTQWSNDEGRSWHGLTVRLANGRAQLPLMGLPPGRVWIRLLALDGYFTTPTEALAIEVPEQQPWPAVVYPSQDGIVPARVAVEATGSAVDQAGRPLPEERLEWLLDSDPVGRGRSVSVRMEPGRHRLSLRVLESDAEHTVTFEAVDMEHVEA
jgi:hypothetical protein